jgi:hypothetical protein
VYGVHGSSLELADELTTTVSSVDRVDVVDGVDGETLLVGEASGGTLEAVEDRLVISGVEAGEAVGNELVVPGVDVALAVTEPPPFGQLGNSNFDVHAAAVKEDTMVGVTEQPWVIQDEVKVLQSVEAVFSAGQDVKIL